MSREPGGAVVAYLGIGSNLGPEDHIARGLALVARKVALQGVSTFYRSPALDRPGHPEFVNGVCRVVTGLAPRALKYDVLRVVERRLGRHRTEDRYAPRTLDLDLLVYGDAVIAEDGLVVPDPDIRSRPFVAVPLLELAPGLVLPDTGDRLADLAVAHDTESLRPDRALTVAIRLGLENESRAR